MVGEAGLHPNMSPYVASVTLMIILTLTKLHVSTGCVNPGESCEVSSDCCNGFCFLIDNTCRGYGGNPCTGMDQCTSGMCTNGACAHGGLGDQCGVDGDCLWPYFCGYVGAYGSARTVCQHATTDDCYENAHCTTQNCNLALGIGTCVCSPLGGPCRGIVSEIDTYDCNCGVPAACRSDDLKCGAGAYQSCSNNDQCFTRECVDGHCTGRGTGAQCKASLVCNSLNCEEGQHCSCANANGACASTADCCTGSLTFECTLQLGNGTKRCCVPTGSTATQSEECCSGFLSGGVCACESDAECGATHICSAKPGSSGKTCSCAWEALGCHKDSRRERLLPSHSTTSPDMTPKWCQKHCRENGYRFAGVEYGNECFCSNALAFIHLEATITSECTMACAGDANQQCGNAWNIMPYWEKCPSTDYSSACCPWVELHCSVDPASSILVSQVIQSTTSMTPAFCKQYCGLLNYPFAAVEAGSKCFCDSTVWNNYATSTGCTYACPGDNTATCGGSEAARLFMRFCSVVTAGDEYWQPQGYIDDANADTLDESHMLSASMTRALCKRFCDMNLYVFAGVRNGNECYCGCYIRGLRITSTATKVACAGNSAEKCGGSTAIEIFAREITTERCEPP